MRNVSSRQGFTSLTHNSQLPCDQGEDLALGLLKKEVATGESAASERAPSLETPCREFRNGNRRIFRAAKHVYRALQGKVRFIMVRLNCPQIGANYRSDRGHHLAARLDLRREFSITGLQTLDHLHIWKVVERW